MSKAPEIVLGHGHVSRDHEAPLGTYVHKESYHEWLRAEIVQVLGEEFIEDNCPHLIEDLGLEDDDE